MCRSELAAQAGGKDVRAPLPTEAFDCLRERLDAFIELIYGNEFAGAMGHADVAGTEDDGFGSEIDQTRRFGAKGDRPRFLAGRFFQELHQRRIGPSFEAFIRASSV